MCGANSRAIDLLPPTGPGAEWTRDLPVDQGREADQVRVHLIHHHWLYVEMSIRRIVFLLVHRQDVSLHLLFAWGMTFALVADCTAVEWHGHQRLDHIASWARLCSDQSP